MTQIKKEDLNDPTKFRKLDKDEIIKPGDVFLQIDIVNICVDSIGRPPSSALTRHIREGGAFRAVRLQSPGYRFLDEGEKVLPTDQYQGLKNDMTPVGVWLSVGCDKIKIGLVPIGAPSDIERTRVVRRKLQPVDHIPDQEQERKRAEVKPGPKLDVYAEHRRDLQRKGIERRKGEHFGRDPGWSLDHQPVSKTINVDDPSGDDVARDLTNDELRAFAERGSK